jgi:hypothetical protein
MHRNITRMTVTAAASAVASIIASSTLSAQAPAKPQPQQQHLTGGNEGKHPIGWKVRHDNPHAAHGAGVDTIAFVQMTPGFHLTTGPAAILYHPDSSASGNYTIESQIFIFPTKGRDREGYGVFFGGRDLDGPAQRYTYLLLRNDGKFIVKQRDGDKTSTLVDWTDLPAIKKATDKAAPNDLRIVVGASSVAFMVNDVEATSIPRTRLSADGVFGLRFNHAVNAHVTSVTAKK